MHHAPPHNALPSPHCAPRRTPTAARRPRVSCASPAPAPWHALAQQRAEQQQRRRRAAAASGLLGAAAPEPAAPDSSKFDRILRFVEQHDIAAAPRAAPAPVASDAAACDSPSWHLSYDEEAEEGDAAPAAPAAPAPHEAARLAAAAASLAAPAGPACSVAFLYPSAAASAASHAAPAAAGAVGSLAYFLAKPLDQSYDEEAEGCFEAAAAEAAAARVCALAARAERRAGARAAATARRAALRAAAAAGDLESMQPWVDDGAAAAAAAAAKLAAGRMPTTMYPNLHAFLSARAGAGRDAVESVIEGLQRERGLTARRNQDWQYTWDEEVHGALSSM